jgi:hypothetical protein
METLRQTIDIYLADDDEDFEGCFAAIESDASKRRMVVVSDKRRGRNVHCKLTQTTKSIR